MKKWIVYLGVVALVATSIAGVPYSADSMNIYSHSPKPTYNCTNISVDFLSSLTGAAYEKYIGMDICVHNATVIDSYVFYRPLYPWFPKVYTVWLNKDGHIIRADSTDKNCSTLFKGEHVDIKGVVVQRFGTDLELDRVVITSLNYS